MSLSSRRPGAAALRATPGGSAAARDRPTERPHPDVAGRGTLSFEGYQRCRFFTSLDGIRAVSVLLVLLQHLPEKSVWGWMNGWLGVTMFFVLSGFLITTLALRESRDSTDGRFSLRGFYTRRVHRIIPLYVVTLAIYAVVSGIFGLIATHEEFTANLPYYLTMSMDIVPDHEPFRHAWSLGVEEKFYFVWPFLLLLLLRVKIETRLVFALVLLAAAAVVSDYTRMYVPIVLGCLLALALNERHLYQRAARVVSVAPSLLLTAVLATSILAALAVRDIPKGAAVFAVLVTVVIGILIMRPAGLMNAALTTRPAKWIAKRSYAIYLLHPLVFHAMDAVIEPDGSSVVTCGARVIVGFGASCLAAEAAGRWIERPLIRRGRRIAVRRVNRPQLVTA